MPPEPVGTLTNIRLRGGAMDDNSRLKEIDGHLMKVNKQLELLAVELEGLTEYIEWSDLQEPSNPQSKS